MLRTTCTALVAVAGLAMVGCNSMNSMGSDGYKGGEGIRFDANGNMIHDPSVANTSGPGNYYASTSGSSNGSYNGSPGMGNNYNGGTPNNEPSNGNWNNSGSNNSWNNTDRSGRDWRNENDRMRGEWSKHWDDANVMTVRESDLPGNVKTTFNREVGNGTITEYHKGMWDGRTAYCAKVQRNGTTYKVVTDQDGNVLASKPIDNR